MKKEFEKEATEHTRIKKLHAQAVKKMQEDSTKIEVLRKENEILKKTVNEMIEKSKA